MSALQPIVIFKGDDTSAFSLRVIRIKLTTDVSLAGATAKFSLLSYKKDFTNAEVLTKQFEIVLSSDVTKKFPLGVIFGDLRLFDASGKVMTASAHIPFEVRLPGRGCTGRWHNAPCSPVEFEVTMSVDYALVFNKPTINGVPVNGDLEGRDYGLNKILPYSASSSYSVGDQVIYGTSMFQCATAVPAGGEVWNPAHWMEIGGSSDTNAVHYTADAGKSDAEKTQARQNVGAASAADLSAHTANRQNPHQVTKAQVGLGNVDNTSDVDKPVSTAQQAALDLKVAVSSLKSAFANPSAVKLSPASIKEYLVALYNAIQAI